MAGKKTTKRKATKKKTAKRKSKTVAKARKGFRFLNGKSGKQVKIGSKDDYRARGLKAARTQKKNLSK